MSELQSEETIDNDEYVEVEENESAEIDSEQSAELATDSEPQHEENSEEPKADPNQEAIQKVIDRKHFEAKEAERKAEEYRKQLEQYQNQQPVAPTIPERPDPFDDDYDAKMQHYEQAVAAKGRHDYEQQVRANQQQQEQQRLQAEQQQKLNESLGKYVESGKKAGMSIEEMQQAGQIVDSYGIGAEIQQALIADEDGALIVKHLAANPAAASEIASMSLYQAALHLDRTIRPMAKQLKPKTTSAPAPNKRVQSGSVDPDLGQHKHVNGSFE